MSAVKLTGFPFRCFVMANWETQSDNHKVQSLTELLQRARTGCSSSRSEAFSRLEGFLYAVAARYHTRQLASKEGLSDIVQQSFIRALQSFEAFRGESSPEFQSWLRQIVVNEIRQSYRSWHRQVRSIAREETLAPNADNDHFLAAVDPTPCTRLTRQEQMERMRRAMETLPEDQKRVIQLRNFQQISLQEIAPMMNRSVEATTKLWYRAILKLRATLADETNSGN